MPKQLEALMWEQACDAMERAERLYRQFFHRSRATAGLGGALRHLRE